MTCDGKYTGREATADGIPIQGALVKLDGNRLTIIGSLFFDGSYAVVRKSENLIVFEPDPTTPATKGVFGNLNRLDGQLALINASADRKYVYQSLFGKCKVAHPLF